MTLPGRVVQEEQGHGGGLGAGLYGQGCLCTLVSQACCPWLFSLLANSSSCSLKRPDTVGTSRRKEHPLWPRSQSGPF